MCNDASISKLDLAEVCLRFCPDWLPIKKDGRTVVLTVGDSS